MPRTRADQRGGDLTDGSGVHAMAITLDMGAADFEPRFRALLKPSANRPSTSTRRSAAIIADVRARGDAALAEYTLRFDRVDLTRSGLPHRPTKKSTRRSRPAIPRRCARWNSPTSASSPIIAARCPSDVAFVDALGVELGWRWRADRLGRPLCSRRRGELSLLGDHERGAGQGGGLPAHRHGRADARRASSIRSCWRRRKSRA